MAGCSGFKMTDVRGNVPFAETPWQNSTVIVFHGCSHFFAKRREAREFREVEKGEETCERRSGNVDYDFSRFQSARQCVRHRYKSELQRQLYTFIILYIIQTGLIINYFLSSCIPCGRRKKTESSRQ